MPNRIFIVQDQPEVLELFEQLLKQTGCAAESFDDFDSAIQASGGPAVADSGDSLQRIASGISHELRNPLGAIVMASKLLRQSASGMDPEHRGLLDAVLRESKRMTEILEDFVRYTRASVPKLAQVELGSILDQAISMVEDQLRISGEADRYAVRREISRLPAALVDRDQLVYLVQTLLTHAVDSQPRGANLVLRAEARDRGIRVTIEPSGIGTSEVASQAFQAFHAETRDGRGLRLPICRKIVEGHRGRIWAKGTEERGGMLGFWIPEN